MTTPGSMQAVGAYRAAMRRLEQASTPAAAPSTTSFENLLQSELTSAAGSLRSSEAASLSALSGKANVQQVVEALTAAELSLQKVTAVRDRVISAYQEIIRMPI